MNSIVLGNGIALLASIVMVLVGFIKDKKGILIFQSIQFSLFALANIILKGTTGFISNIVSIIRNLLATKVKITPIFKIFFMAIQLILSLISGIHSFVAWMPVISGLLITWYIDLDDPVMFKTVIVICSVSWILYDISIKNYVSFMFDIFSTISTIYTIYKMKKS